MPLQAPASINVTAQVNFTVPAGNSVQQAYNIPVSPPFAIPLSPGTGANQANKVAYLGGSAAGAPVTIDLTTAVCVDGSVGFGHVRALILYNDNQTDGQILTFDATVANSFLANEETAVKIDIQAAACLPFFKPLGTNGWPVSSTNKLVTLNPAANTCPYRVLVVGD